MARSGSRPDALRRLLSGLARQLDLPFLGTSGTSGTSGATGPSAPGARPTPDRRTVPGATDPAKRPGPHRAAPPAVAQRRIRLGERTLDYSLRRTRRKTIGFSISAGGLTVAAPGWVGIRQIEGAIRDREQWVLQKLSELRRHQAATPTVRWQDGGTLPYLGLPITLRVVDRPRSTARARATAFDAARRTLTVQVPADATEAQVRERVQAWMQDEARTLFRERLAFYEARLGLTHRVLRLSSARTRWGSCSADGRILLNWRLIHFPLASIDYVVAHELAHLKEMNHGPRFWATVASILPGYEIARAAMKNPPPALLPTL